MVAFCSLGFFCFGVLVGVFSLLSEGDQSVSSVPTELPRQIQQQMHCQARMTEAPPEKR